MISTADLFKIINGSSNVEQAFCKYMSLLDSEHWDFSALPTIFEGNEREELITITELVEIIKVGQQYYGRIFGRYNFTALPTVIKLCSSLRGEKEKEVEK